jgi:acetoin utilization protein AcuC
MRSIVAIVPSMSDQPLLVFGPRSLDYDFGSAHPLTPRRFGPGIDLLQAVGAVPGIAPEPASDDELRLAHTAAYIEVVRRFSEFDHGWMEPEAGIGVGGDDPPFHGMHDAAAAVAGGSLRAIEAILSGDVEHAFHPGGGLHHAMPGRASGFCIYDDPALAIARARLEGRRVLYVDVDVHHGDGVEVIHAADPGVLTLSIHESGRYLFPGSGFVDDVGEGSAAGTIVDVPLEPDTGEAAWLAAVRTLVPEIAATFGPDLVVSQHGADSHAWDPLAHLRNTTTAMGAAARLVDRVAHRFAGGQWLSTGGGGYGVYDVVPRSWSLVWLAAAHRDMPDRLPVAWRERWAGEAARYGTRTLPTTFQDPPNAGDPPSRSTAAADRQSAATAALVRALHVPALVKAGVDTGWWDPLGPSAPGLDSATQSAVGDDSAPTIASIDAAGWSALTVEPRVASPAGVGDLHRLVGAGLAAPEAAGPQLRVTAAILAGRLVVGLAVSVVEPDQGGPEELVALGVAPGWRRRGLGSALLRDHVAGVPDGVPITATVTVAERDVVEPLDHAVRMAVARRLLEGAGFVVERAPDPLGRVDPRALAAIRR